MKHILFVRHAKSDWSDGTLSDFQRPLNSRGKHDAPLMAKYLQDKGLQPTYLLSSPANRALSTAQLFAEVFRMEKESIATDESLYEAFTAQLIDAVKTLPDEHDTVAIFSHNPSITSAVAQFAESYIGNIPTCGVGVISFEGKRWADFSPENADLSQLLFPKAVLNEYK